MPCPEKAQRNEKICHLIECGHTFAEVAEIFHISTVRVVQIYNARFRKKFSYLNSNKEEKING